MSHTVPTPCTAAAQSRPCQSDSALTGRKQIGDAGRLAPAVSAAATSMSNLQKRQQVLSRRRVEAVRSFQALVMACRAWLQKKRGIARCGDKSGYGTA